MFKLPDEGMLIKGFALFLLLLAIIKIAIIEVLGLTALFAK
jgi:hypothetical protein